MIEYDTTPEPEVRYITVAVHADHNEYVVAGFVRVALENEQIDADVTVTPVAPQGATTPADEASDPDVTLMRRAAASERAAERHWPADMLMEAADTIECLRAALAASPAGETARALRIDADDWQHIYWRDPVEGCWVAYKRLDCIGDEEVPDTRLPTALATTPADQGFEVWQRLARAAFQVDSTHHFHEGPDGRPVCACGFVGSARKRSQTEHITAAVLEAFDHD